MKGLEYNTCINRMVLRKCQFSFNFRFHLKKILSGSSSLAESFESEDLSKRFVGATWGQCYKTFFCS